MLRNRIQEEAENDYYYFSYATKVSQEVQYSEDGSLVNGLLWLQPEYAIEQLIRSRFSNVRSIKDLADLEESAYVTVLSKSEE